MERADGLAARWVGQAVMPRLGYVVLRGCSKYASMVILRIVLWAVVPPRRERCCPRVQVRAAGFESSVNKIKRGSVSKPGHNQFATLPIVENAALQC